MPETVAGRLERLNERIARAAERAGRAPDEVRLLAVSKFHPADAVAEAIDAGHRLFGENRFQEAPEKIAALRERFPGLAGEVQWHFIGSLQSNKVKPVLETFDWVQSIDRVKLLNRVERIAAELGITARVLLQVNVSGADSQGGVELDELEAFAAQAAGREHLRVDGLMTIGPLTEDEREIRTAFARVRAAAERLAARDLPGVEMGTLSMGMTGDFELAIEEGSTLVRIGTAIFGPRPT